MKVNQDLLGFSRTEKVASFNSSPDKYMQRRGLGKLTRLFSSHLWREAAPLYLGTSTTQAAWGEGSWRLVWLIQSPPRLCCNLNCQFWIFFCSTMSTNVLENWKWKLSDLSTVHTPPFLDSPVATLACLFLLSDADKFRINSGDKRGFEESCR